VAAAAASGGGGAAAAAATAALTSALHHSDIGGWLKVGCDGFQPPRQGAVYV
jgi:hypothetical protein